MRLIAGPVGAGGEGRGTPVAPERVFLASSMATHMIGGLAMSVHGAVRPGWTCAGCGLPWPCATRRRQLAAEYMGAPTSLMVYLAACFVDACEDMPHATVGGLYARFLLWPRLLTDADTSDGPAHGHAGGGASTV